MALEERELGLIEGFLLCLWDADAVRAQSARWKRSLLLFSSGVALEIALLAPVGGWLNCQMTWQVRLLTGIFAPLGLLGLYASKFGDDRLVDWLLILPKFDRRA